MKRIEKGDVVVITGASSGIGKSLAERLSKYGCHLVLVSRNADKLAEVAKHCQSLGASTEVHSLDVAEQQALPMLADHVYKSHGRIDVWVNNAGVGAIGSFTDIPLADHLRVIETNFHGYLFGSHAAMKIFEAQGRGVLINNASISAYVVMPYAVSYNASKYAIRALTESLQQDLKVDGKKNIHACLINPEVVDTPAFHHAANYSGAPIRMPLPMVSAEDVAARMIELISNPREESFVGKLAVLGSFGQRYCPWLAKAILRWGTKRHFQQGTAATKPPQRGALHNASSDAPKVDGGWKNHKTNKV